MFFHLIYNHQQTFCWDILFSSQKNMAPLIPIFSASSLPDHVNTVTKNFKEKPRKGPPVELEKCQLLEMTQYACFPPEDLQGPAICTPLVRLFRR